MLWDFISEVVLGQGRIIRICLFKGGPACMLSDEKTPTFTNKVLFLNMLHICINVYTHVYVYIYSLILLRA